MKRKYMKPTMLAVRLQHQSIICQSVNRVLGNGNVNYGGSDADYAENGGELRSRESSSIWDEDW